MLLQVKGTKPQFSSVPLVPERTGFSLHAAERSKTALTIALAIGLRDRAYGICTRPRRIASPSAAVRSCTSSLV